MPDPAACRWVVGRDIWWDLNAYYHARPDGATKYIGTTRACPTVDDTERYEGWSYRPTRSGIRDQCEKDEYRRGNKIHEDGGVQFVEIARNELLAIVRDEYQREVVRINDTNWTHRCSCWHATRTSGHCRHVVAVLLYLAYNLDDIEEAEQIRIDSAPVLPSKVSARELQDFVADCLRDDPIMYRDFVRRFKLQDASILRSYSQLIKNLYQQSSMSDSLNGMVRFGRLFKSIRKGRDAGEHAETTAAYQTVLEAVSDHLDRFEDDNPYYVDCLVEALEGMADSVAREGIPPDKKRPRIKYLFERCVDERHKPYWSNYRGALEAICDTPDDLKYWRSLVSGAPPAREPDSQYNMHHMTAHILHVSGHLESALDLLSKHYKSDRGICMKYAALLRGADRSRARKAGEDIMAAYPDDARIAKDLLPLYDTTDAAYPDILRRVFVATGEWEYFNALKRISRDWSGEVRLMGDALIKLDHHERAVDAYLKAGMHPEATDAVVLSRDVELYHKYSARLAKVAPEAYVRAYGDQVRAFIQSRSARDHYETALIHLERIRNLSRGGKAFGKLLQTIRAENSRKYVLLHTIRNL